ncbi:acylneuraminate cytidylyltransferase, partial [cyanobacterium TDX16]
MRVLGLVPARGGSKGVPGKNGKDLLGRPLLAWTADSARRAELLDDVVL